MHGNHNTAKRKRPRGTGKPKRRETTTEVYSGLRVIEGGAGSRGRGSARLRLVRSAD